MATQPTTAEVGSNSTTEKQAKTIRPTRNLPPPIQVQKTSPRFPQSPATPTPITTAISPSHRRIAIAIDLSDESAYSVKWAVENYLRHGDAVILLHVQSTSVLYGADWGSSTPTNSPNSINSQSKQELEEEFEKSTTAKANKLAQPLKEAGHVSYKIHIVKDHDMKERLCLEVERLNLSAVILGSRGIGASRRNCCKGKLGSVSNYCVQHCACPVVVVRYNNNINKNNNNNNNNNNNQGGEEEEEENHEFHDADDNHPN
ncbi:hypothetical protein ACJIZ3_010818 [Penstemon smallii]|uniref:UspA domain-containing protein n=1 Tax=Penstemon smallii TaxID=265156 RepID=A0ABD3UJ01_9LAMI